jgi:hypothetical protein
MLAAFGTSIAAGLLGALLGLGGGIIVVPALTLLLGVDIRYAIGASLISVIATSCAAGSSYVKDRWSNIRLGMFLEPGTTIGAMVGAFIAGLLNPQWLHLIFAALLVFVTASMLRQRDQGGRADAPNDPLADALRLHGSVPSAQGGGEGESSYRVHHALPGLLGGGGAGLVSGLLGVGGGLLKVPLMTLAMGVPLKAATATSNFMIGVTGAASAGVYFSRGDIDPVIAGPVAVGVLIGATIGARLISRAPRKALRAAFSAVLLFTAFQMFRKGMA